MGLSDQELIEQIFLNAVKLPPECRLEFVERASQGNEHIFREVQSLLQYHLEQTLMTDVETREVAGVLSNEPTEPLARLRSRLTRLLPANRLIQWFEFAKNRSLLIGILITACVLAYGAWVSHQIHHSVVEVLQRNMSAILKTEEEALRVWWTAEEEVIDSWSRDPELIKLIQQLNRTATESEFDSSVLESSPIQLELRAILDSLSNHRDSMRYAFWDRSGRLIADHTPVPGTLGNPATEYGAALLSRVYRGESVLWLPGGGTFITSDWQPPPPTSEEDPDVGIAVIVPVEDEQGRIIAAMMVGGMGLQERMQSLISAGWFGESGDVYAFDENGYLITQSRFSESLRSQGMIPEDAPTTHHLRLGTPPRELSRLDLTQETPEEWPLTRMATSATNGKAGSDFEGYPDYRGVKVVGVWTWLERVRVGLAVEADYDHAFEPDQALSRAFLILFAGALVVVILGTAAWWSLFQYQKQTNENLIGPYRIEKKIGEGGLANVFLARHALLSRPTAIKILKDETLNHANQARFEREVKLASSLTHPNTIEIYDYGHSSDGKFYYAMEYVDGLTLAELIDRTGPVSPERSIYLLKQACGSLKEAHQMGMIHRDIKPQNIMVCQRGGEWDVVKVLDFGLAKGDTLATEDSTATQQLVGTPQYIAPERIRDPMLLDVRTDIYSIGVVAFNLLTGSDLFTYHDPIEALNLALNMETQEPSEKVSGIPDPLNKLVASCLAQNPADRPQSMSEIIDILDTIPCSSHWGPTQAEAWWKRQPRDHSVIPGRRDGDLLRR